MAIILVIPNSDFSRNHINKVSIVKKLKYLEEVKKTVDNQTTTSYSSSTISVNNLSLKIMINNNGATFSSLAELLSSENLSMLISHTLLLMCKIP